MIAASRPSTVMVVGVHTCDDYQTEKGIERDEQTPKKPELNGLAERSNRTLMESSRSMMFHAGKLDSFWAEAVTKAADIRNRFLCPRNNSKSSYELPTGRKPRVDHIRVFGSTAWIHVPKQKRRKLDEKSSQGIVVGCFENNP